MPKRTKTEDPDDIIEPVAQPATARLRKRVRRLLLRGVAVAILFVFSVILVGRFLNPWTTLYILSEAKRLGGVDYEFVSMEDIAPVMARSAVAAEDANFCLHWGLDLDAIRSAMNSGGNRGGSTISQQVVKNLYLWPERTWSRKAMEAVLTPAVELVWPKERILEVYLNIAEFDEGVFGVQAAAQSYFGVDAADLSAAQASRLATVLPAPKSRDAANLSESFRSRAASIRDGAATIDRDGRAACFQAADD
ncbi:monofunctional biosynthetic peptidoglycan transglycosylase [Marivivens donghaensis]|uniref:Biosynthetic peptidoglycan transglycosylase n=1 Tax=Marivivens donghaensis TaxID=1699413 RepID=A0ABX0VUD7_9RHOB|nr:monofunctional biosynthetic peptidoglycan transglycosylase [Marivivens donghaensis]NIY71516.1 monofunctional biosynthetic peptidoglycan transglycosylase [Marivivens donghaensis]